MESDTMGRWRVLFMMGRDCRGGVEIGMKRFCEIILVLFQYIVICVNFVLAYINIIKYPILVCKESFN